MGRISALLQSGVVAVNNLFHNNSFAPDDAEVYSIKSCGGRAWMVEPRRNL